MCGIVGIICKKTCKIAKSLYLAGIQIKRRGPDDEGYVLFGEKGCDVCGARDSIWTEGLKLLYLPKKDIKGLFEKSYSVGLGHRRLSILDLSVKGHQPMCDETGRFWIVYNGEVYNFREIREELKNLGYFFASSTDTEVVLKAYIEWREECLQRFNGMFAFTIYDAKERKIFLARDRIGIKPLYYILSSDIFIFASDIKTLIATGLYRPEINWEGLYHNFSFGITPRPNTSFKGILALPQAHYMILNVTNFNHQIYEYWDIPTGVQNINMREEEAVKLLEEELKRAVRYRLIADVEVGTFMSGGVDSTTISAIASRLHPGIKAFTLAFDKRIIAYNEVEEARDTARKCKMQHIVEEIKPSVVLNNIEKMVLGYEEPFYHLAANFAISKIVNKHGIKVILNGLGGDELFAGYRFYAKVPKWKKLSTFKGLLKYFPPLHRKIRKLQIFAGLKDLYELYAYFYCIYLDYEKQELFGPFKFSSLEEIKRLYQKTGKEFTDDIELLNYLDIKSYIGNHHVHRLDQFTMYFSIEGRFPFLDHQLIEKVFTIPSRYKLNNGIHKYVLKKVAEKYISPLCLKMKKKGFGLPLEYWFHTDLKELVVSCIENLKKRKIFPAKAIERIMKKGTIYQKWHLVMFELWYRKFFEEKFPERELLSGNKL